MIDFFKEKNNFDDNQVQSSEQLVNFYNLGKELVYITEPVNKIPFFQKGLHTLFDKTTSNQLILFRFETIKGRIRRIQKSKPGFIARIQVIWEFFIFRIIPRIFLFKYFYNKLMKEKLRLLSKAEGLGRMVFAGFEIYATENSAQYTYVLIRKSKVKIKKQKPSFGIIYGMPRIGQHGEIFKVYKIRTMHPYSEFLQAYILKENGYGMKGKPKNDFRVTCWGKFLRKYWIDELPQLYNVIKGDMKLVGLRPVSETYFNELNEEFRKLRLTLKPGCIPPYVALNRNPSKESVIKAESDYVDMKLKNSYTTDTKLFLSALKNIIFLNKRGS